MRLLLLLFIGILLNFVGTTGGFQNSGTSELQKLKLDTDPAPAPLSFEDEELQNFKDNPEFDYSEKRQQDNWWTRFKSYVSLQYHRFLQWLFEDYQTNSFIQFLIQTIPYLILGGILYFAIWIFNRMNPATVMLGEKAEGKVFLSEEEEIIRSQNISQLMDQAVAGGNYRLAIRYYFLWILQQLTERNIINYEFSKTDTDYLSEIKEPALQQQFRKLSRIYDYFWYGNFEATFEHFERSKREFQQMQEIVKKQ